jgi:ethanolamine utilization protein EutA
MENEGDQVREEIISVGIDIGTSTTQLIFSKLVLENMASSFSVPRITIVGKEIIYRSDIYFTPLIGEKIIDISQVMEIIEGEYKRSAIERDSIKVGAVIITGETARKENAGEVLKRLSGYAGDFVVAAAGPDLESIISGKGAGADEYSKEHSNVVVNIDVGGGTSNLAVFDQGEAIATGCLDIGGRLVKIDKASNKIYYIYRKVKDLIKAMGLNIAEGDPPDRAQLEALADEMVRILEMSVNIRPKDQYYDLFLTNDKGFAIEKAIDAISFSGGVADYVYGNENESDIYKYGDMGIILGRRIRASQLITKLQLLQSRETIRATVVGAGSHTTEISGSTITYSEEKLPLKNLPILKLTTEDTTGREQIVNGLKTKLDWYRLDGELQNLAIGFEGLKNPGFKDIETTAEGIIEGGGELIKRDFPLVVIVERDMAKVLGQTLRRMLQYQKDVICVDSIKVENGDYVDVGKPLAEGKVLPVVIKTLVFNK